MDEKKKAKLGQRWVCFSCECKFYDLNKPEPVCPRCESNQLESPLAKKQAKKRKPARKRKSTPKREPPVRTLDDEDANSSSDEGVAFEDLEIEGSEQLGSVQTEDD